MITNILTAISFNHQPEIIKNVPSWEKLYPGHSQLLLQIELKTPYQHKKEVILVNDNESLYLKNVILINSSSLSDDQASAFTSQVDSESDGVFTALIPTQHIGKIRNQKKIIALPKDTPEIEMKKNKKSKVAYEVIY